jgi:hypothetical protein
MESPSLLPRERVSELNAPVKRVPVWSEGDAENKKKAEILGSQP